MKKPLVGIIMGSQSDLKLMSKAAEVLDEFGIPHEVSVISAHRAPELTCEYASKAASRGLKVIIAGAGGAAHLPGVVAALTTLPVIGVPVKSANSMGGLDSLLSIVQMPEGVPVATVAVDGARNAGILAAQIIATSDENVSSQMKDHKDRLRKKIEDVGHKITLGGYKSLL
ncbi:MAG: 5-(carboxyamino)imidazole ribonucleotide mutase [Candidatus Omnitrophica bacterium]|nr:5-(carboxyamino)imidazole ribonucleotide mutase [Candidatus Omnitrophota bacterium]MDE2008903.1 5-(carboxyamino)imidazole ribonucleotide mutase [Candidatus Omnitrophota bacterium]MDE2213534.1 5-(carboxyamino)imidazole ribonucleotide mutase [Candidatus Omnitrophota bacterium]MDE2230565.1 5-(carboxyamino)imidazole ribonucleotide mutase [Candidatus Omnitrophota bacterium]